MAGPVVNISVLADTRDAAKNLQSFGDSAGKAFAVVGAAALVGVAAIGGFLLASVKAAAEAEKIAAQTEAVLASTGGAAGRTAEQIDGLASSLSRMSGIDDEVIQAGENVLLTFTRIQGANFDAATAAALDMSVALGKDMASSATLVGKALNDPIAGIGALSKVGVQLTDDQKNLIKSMVEVGDVAGAQGVILAELNTQFGGSAEAFGNTFLGSLEKVKNAFGNLQEVVGGALLPVLTVVFGKVAALIEGVTASPGFQSFITRFGEFVTSVLSGEGAVGGLISQLAPLLAFLSPLGIILQVIKPLLPQLMDGFKQVAGAIGGALVGILPTVVGLLQTVVGVLSGALAKILPILIPLIVQLATTFGTVLATILPVVGVLLEAVVEIIAALIPVLMPVIEAVLGIVSAFLPLLPILAELIAALLPPVIELLTSLLIPILGLIAPLMELLGPAIQFVASVLAAIIGVVVEVITAFVGLITGSEETQRKVQGIWQAVTDFFGGIPEAIAGFFAGAGTLLVQVGKDIIAGLQRGIENAIQGVFNFLEDAAQNIANTFASVLGIASPSKVFKGYGKNIVQGLQLGLKASNSLDSIMGNLSGQITGGFNAPLSVPAGYAASGSAPTINVNFNGLVGDPVAAGREVKNVLDEYYRFGVVA